MSKNASINNINVRNIKKYFNNYIQDCSLVILSTALLRSQQITIKIFINGTLMKALNLSIIVIFSY